jgi:hypothetical protein
VLLPTGFEYREAEYVAGTARRRGPIALDFSSTHAHIAKADWGTRGVAELTLGPVRVRSRARAERDVRRDLVAHRVGDRHRPVLAAGRRVGEPRRGREAGRERRLRAATSAGSARTPVPVERLLGPLV